MFVSCSKQGIYDSRRYRNLHRKTSQLSPRDTVLEDFENAVVASRRRAAAMTDMTRPLSTDSESTWYFYQSSFSHVQHHH